VCLTCWGGKKRVMSRSFLLSGRINFALDSSQFQLLWLQSWLKSKWGRKWTHLHILKDRIKKGVLSSSLIPPEVWLPSWMKSKGFFIAIIPNPNTSIANRSCNPFRLLFWVFSIPPQNQLSKLICFIDRTARIGF